MKKILPVIKILIISVVLIASLLLLREALNSGISTPQKTEAVPIHKPLIQLFEPDRSSSSAKHETVVGSVTVFDGSVEKEYSFMEHDCSDVNVGPEATPIAVRFAFKKSFHLVKAYFLIERNDNEWIITGSVSSDDEKSIEYSGTAPVSGMITITVKG